MDAVDHARIPLGSLRGAALVHGLLELLDVALGPVDLGSIRVDALWWGAAGLVLDPAPRPGRTRLYDYGLLLYALLTGDHDPGFAGVSNAPDPRETAPSSPPMLSALAMDLLLVEECDRPDVDEVRATLLAMVPERIPLALRARLATGGVARLEDHADALARWTTSIQLDDPELIALIEGASAMSKLDRTLMVAWLQHPETLRPGQLARAADQLALTLVISGVDVLVWNRAVQPDALAFFVRADRSPLVLLPDAEWSDARLAPLRAAGVEIDRDERSPAVALDQLPVPTSADGPLWSGVASAIDEALVELNLAVDAGWVGRTSAMVRRWFSPSTLASVRADSSRASAAAGLLAPLAWVDPERALLLADKLVVEARSKGDADLATMAASLGAAVGRPVPQATPQDGEGAAEYREVGKALASRYRGDAAGTARRLSALLPLRSLEAAGNGALGLLLAEALFLEGRWREARRLGLGLSVDARVSGNRMLELGVLTLNVCMGSPDEEMEELAAKLPPVILSPWLRRARVWRALKEGDLSSASQLAAQTLGRPWARMGALHTESQVLAARLAAASRGEAPAAPAVVHPAADAWAALGEAAAARATQSRSGIELSLRNAAARFDGAGRPLEAAAASRFRGLWAGGPHGGQLVEQADAVLAATGIAPPLVSRMLLPELGY